MERDNLAEKMRQVKEQEQQKKALKKEQRREAIAARKDRQRQEKALKKEQRREEFATRKYDKKTSRDRDVMTREQSENGKFVKAILFFSIPALLAIAGLICYVCVRISFSHYTQAWLTAGKVCFIAIFPLALVSILFSYWCSREFDIWLYIAVPIVAIVLAVITLLSASRLFSTKSYYVDPGNNVTYACKGDHYEVVAVTGQAETVVLHPQIEGMAVSLLLHGDNAYMKKLVLEPGLWKIGEDAFTNVPNLKTIHAEKCIMTLEDGAFQNCEQLRDVYVGNGELKSYSGLDMSKRFTFGNDRVTLHVGAGKFVYTDSHTESIQNMIFEDGFDFSESDFSHCYEAFGLLTSEMHYCPVAKNIYLPASVAEIPEYFFGNEGDCTVYYAGTQEQWAGLNIPSEGNESYSAGNVQMVYQYAG